MRISTGVYHLKQGIKSIFRNNMMSIASISTVMASLLILGIFFLTIINVNYMVKGVESSVQVKAFLKDGITEEQKNLIGSEMNNIPGVTKVQFETKEQALENFKKELGNNSDLVEGVDPDKVMPESYIISMNSPKVVDKVVQKLETMEGIDEVKDGRTYIDKLIKITDFVKNLSLGLMAILLVVSVFLISNTIKLTVIARRREIGIMKYIGATNWFIRWPFVIEGVLLGLIGAAISGALISYGYSLAVESVNEKLMIVNLMSPNQVIPLMSAVFLGIGAVLGFIGSAVSMRKFLNV